MIQSGFITDEKACDSKETQAFYFDFDVARCTYSFTFMNFFAHST